MYSLQFGPHIITYSEHHRHHHHHHHHHQMSSSSTSRAIGLMQTFGIKKARSAITKVLAAQDQKLFKSRSFYAENLFSE